MFISRCIYLNFPHKHISEIQNRRERPFIAWLHVVYLLHDFTGVYHITVSEWDVQGGFLVMDTPERKSYFKTASEVHLMIHPLYRPYRPLSVHSLLSA